MNEVAISRVFEAPRELVFQAWTDSDHLAHWFAPPGCEIEIRHLDARPGGSFHTCIRPPGHHDCWCKGEYREFSPPDQIAFTMVVSDEEGNTVTPIEAGMDPEWPQETVVTVTFTEQEGKTRVDLHQTVSRSLAERTGAYPSWLLMFDRLAEDLAAGLSAGGASK